MDVYDFTPRYQRAHELHESKIIACLFLETHKYLAEAIEPGMANLHKPTPRLEFRGTRNQPFLFPARADMCRENHVPRGVRLCRVEKTDSSHS